MFTINYTNTHDLHQKTKALLPAFLHSPLLFLLILLFFHGELILGCGSQKCKLEPDLFFASEVKTVSHLMFCSLSLVKKNGPGWKQIVQFHAAVSVLLSHNLHPCSLCVLSFSQVLEFARSCLTDYVRPVSGFGGLLWSLKESVSAVKVASQCSFRLMCAACLLCVACLHWAWAKPACGVFLGKDWIAVVFVSEMPGFLGHDFLDAMLMDLCRSVNLTCSWLVFFLYVLTMIENTTI